MLNQIQLNEFSWETMIAILGALAWLPWIFEKINRPKLYGRLISNFDNQGFLNQKTGTLHFLKLSISCVNNNFNVDNISIQIKYLNNNKWYDGNLFWARTSIWSMNSEGTIKKQLVIPHENYLGFVNMFEKDKSSFYHLTFIVEKEKFEEFEIIKISFINPKKITESIEFRKENINPDSVLFDDNIWKDYQSITNS